MPTSEPQYVPYHYIELPVYAKSFVNFEESMNMAVAANVTEGIIRVLWK